MNSPQKMFQDVLLPYLPRRPLQPARRKYSLAFLLLKRRGVITNIFQSDI